MRATVLDTESGIQCTTDGPDSFEWAENNWSCDCNRASLFRQDIGSVCQSKRFPVIDAKFNPGEREYSLNELNSGYPKDVFDKFIKKEPTMSVRITKHGEDKSRKMSGKCNTCGCEVECCESDTRAYPEGLTGFPPVQWIAGCPEPFCGMAITVRFV